MNVVLRKKPAAVQRHFGYESPLTQAMIDHYNSIGPREGDIELAFSLVGNPHNANVLEIGCGLGRDAAMITEKTPYYLGLDTADDVIKIARRQAPKGHFEVADAFTYDYPRSTYDLVFCFATLRHHDKSQTKKLLARLLPALKPGGVVYLSMHFADEYKIVDQDDRFGPRKIAYYNPDLVTKLAGNGYLAVHQRVDTVMGVKWFEIALKKRAE